ncbi:DUF4097 family beta strand repeat-containing protein [Anaerosalibacter sp. Marseille-P3206]|uniref:DUF4097 family beta strand repeat-containing protein n=1 Tax=Anaerosalibacter sp. Marseille-P3206 TaxID=1871005 RepID=UPI0009862849|nr:DUF4097 family beta strand repeat-containing protein [Anaerosalibacter sp. Marseille-P3206]
MKEERMMILTMLEEGKISSEEALKLLDAIDDTPEDVEEEFIITDEDKTQEKDEKKINFEKTMEKVEKTLKEQGKKVGDLGADLGNKISELFSGIKDKSSSVNFWGNYETSSTTLEKDISHIDEPIIDLSSVNGSISVKTWEKQSLLIKVICNYKKGVLDENDTFYDFYEEDNKIIFRPNFTSNIGIKLEVYLPDKKYDNIILNTSNAKIEVNKVNLNSLICDTTNSNINVSDIVGKDVKLATKNGKIYIEKVQSPIILANSTNSSMILNKITGEKVFVATKNGRIYLDEIIADSIDATTSNSNIETKKIKGRIIRLNTSNSKIICDDLDSEGMEKLELITSNSGINAHFDKLEGETYFDLETSLGTINLEIPNLVYKINQQNKLGTRKIIAHSINFNEDEANFKFIASTSNGSIKIDKEG